MKEQLFKILNDDGSVLYGIFGWHLPQDDMPGDWMPPIIGDLQPCENGYHLCRIQDLLKWFGPAIFEAECRGERIDCDDKIVVREARLLRRLVTWHNSSARLFACDCAEHILYIYEESYPNDDCPRRTIEIARRHALDDASNEELLAARNLSKTATTSDRVWLQSSPRNVALAASWTTTQTPNRAAAEASAIARVAAGAVAGAVARTVPWKSTWPLPRPAAWVRTKAITAAETAGNDAEREWQLERLLWYLYPDTAPAGK